MNSLINNNVNIGGAQTVTGEKTFTNNPLLPLTNLSDSSSKAASTNWVKSNITNAIAAIATSIKGNNGYYKFDNGLIVQWGRASSGTTVSVNFSTPFTDGRYALSFVMIGSTEHTIKTVVDSLTATGFNFVSGDTDNILNKRWIAVGC